MRVLHVLLGLLVFVGVGQGAEKPRSLTDGQLDEITAGNTQVTPVPGAKRGGVIVGNSSAATVRRSGVVDLQGSAQQQGRALNLVNASASAVANGGNVWNGPQTGTTAGGTFNVGQANFLLQDQRRLGSLGEWKLEGINLDESFQQTRSITSQGQVVPQFLLTTIPIGVGFAGAGTFAGDIGAGAVSIDSVISTTVTTSGEVCVFFGLICHTETETTTDTETVTGGVSFGPISVQVVDGSACLVIFGTCSIDASLSITSEGSRTILVPASMAGAEGEYIAMSDGTLEVETNYSVFLSDAAQEGVRALNAVNAAGSVVANGVNVARTLVGAANARGLVLNQSNTILQRQ